MVTFYQPKVREPAVAEPAVNFWAAGMVGAVTTEVLRALAPAAKRAREKDFIAKYE